MFTKLRQKKKKGKAKVCQMLSGVKRLKEVSPETLGWLHGEVNDGMKLRCMRAL